MITTQLCVKLVKFKQVVTKHHLRSIEIKKFLANVFSDELNQELGNLVANNFPLNRNIFDNVFDQLVNIIAKTIDKNVPFERMSRKPRELAGKPLITKGILTSVGKKNSMFRTHFITSNTEEKSFFRRYSNMLSKKVRRSFSNFEVAKVRFPKSEQFLGPHLIGTSCEHVIPLFLFANFGR